MSSQSILVEHAPFSPSQPGWLKMDDDAIISAYKKRHASDLGTELHEWASVQINLGNKVSSGKEVEKGLRTHIYEKYRRSEFESYRQVLLKAAMYLPSQSFATVKTFVNDSIGFRMASEVKLFYSDYIFGTADAIRCEDSLLRVFDLKTGVTPAKMEQLFVYAGLYCLENKIHPADLDFETRIYQSDDVYTDTPESCLIEDIMERIVHVDNVLTKLERGRR